MNSTGIRNCFSKDRIYIYLYHAFRSNDVKSIISTWCSLQVNQNLINIIWNEVKIACLHNMHRIYDNGTFNMVGGRCMYIYRVYV